MDKNKARDIIRESSLLDYIDIFEANVDKGGTARSSSTMGYGNSTNQDKQPDEIPNSFDELDPDKDDKESSDEKPDSKGTEVKKENGEWVLYKDGKKVPSSDSRSKSFFKSRKWKEKKDSFINQKNKFMRGFKRGMSESELSEARNSLGLNETTTSGAIASMSSVVGDTSDSHKPTVQLRSRIKKEKEEDEIKNNKKKRKKKNAKKEREDQIIKRQR